MSAELMNQNLPIDRPAVSQLSLNLMHRFLSYFGCCFFWTIWRGIFLYFKKKIVFYEIFFVFVNKTLLLLQITATNFQTSVYIGYFWQLSVWGHSGVIQYISDFQQPCISKTAAHRAEQWNLSLGGEYSVYTGYFWQLSAWGHSGVIRCISNFWRPCISLMAGRRAKRSEIWG